MLKFEIQTADNVKVEVTPHNTARGLGALVKLTFENEEVKQEGLRWRKEHIVLDPCEVDELVTALQNTQ